MQVNVHDAKTNLSRLLEAVEGGEMVTICRNGTPVARLVPANHGRLELGSGRGPNSGKSDAWWQAMSDDEAESFLEGR